MTYTTRPSIKPARARRAHAWRAYAWLLALATGPGLIAVSCSDDADPDPVGGAGTGGSSSSDAGSGGSSSGSGGSAAGTGGSASSAAGSSGDAGSAGSTGMPSAGSGGSAGSGSSSAEFTLTSPAFDGVEGCGPDDADVCDLFPDETTDFAGDNISPQLDWTGAPAGTQSFAIALHDLSNPIGQNNPFTHWVMWNIPASTTGLPEGLPDGETPEAPAPSGSEQVSIGDNDGFFGSGARGNVYEFVLYALATPAIDPAGDPDDVQEFIEELDDEILGTATLRARSTPPQD